MSIKHQPTGRGFTLIEVLVVVSIIGLLTSIVLGSLGTARMKGRDAARITDVRELKKAMEFYFDDNKQYPQIGFPSGTAIANLGSALVPQYIGAIPQILIDGDGSGTTDSYVKGTSQYGLRIYLEGRGAFCKTGVNMSSSWWTTDPVCTEF